MSAKFIKLTVVTHNAYDARSETPHWYNAAHILSIRRGQTADTEDGAFVTFAAEVRAINVSESVEQILALIEGAKP